MFQKHNSNYTNAIIQVLTRLGFANANNLESPTEGKVDVYCVLWTL